MYTLMWTEVSTSQQPMYYFFDDKMLGSTENVVIHPTSIYWTTQCLLQISPWIPSYLSEYLLLGLCFLSTTKKSMASRFTLGCSCVFFFFFKQSPPLSFLWSSICRRLAYQYLWLGISSDSTYSGEEKWQPTPVFLPGESHELRNLVGFRP